MSGQGEIGRLERIAVVGDDALARAVAEAVEHQAELELAGLVGAGDALPEGTGFVLCLSAREERGQALERAVRAGLPVATLPLADTDEASRQLLARGQVVQVSPLRGYVALETLRREVQRGALGRPYGLYASHRFGPVPGGAFGERGEALLHYAYDVAGEPIEMAQTTRRALFGDRPDAAFVIARAAGGLLMTIEFVAALGDGEEQVLIEATGSEAVLRAEPTRQAVLISGTSGTRQEPWWSSPGPGFLAAALSAIRTRDPARELAYLDFLAAVRQSADSEQALSLG